MAQLLGMGHSLCRQTGSSSSIVVELLARLLDGYCPLSVRT